MLTRFTAMATTCDVSPGEESSGEEGVLRVRNRVFTDLVESEDVRIAGTNKPTLNIDINTASGEAVLQGQFALVPATNGGSWRGELSGRISEGLVTAFGVARGEGALAGCLLRVDFRQVGQPSTSPPCADPKAFFEMEGWILEA